MPLHSLSDAARAAGESFAAATGHLHLTENGERYMRAGQALTNAMPSTAATHALITRRLGAVAPPPSEDPRAAVASMRDAMTDAAAELVSGTLRGAAEGIAWLTEREKMLSTLVPAAYNAVSGSAATASGTLSFGLPHGHVHPPTPPVPLPSVGQLLPIPYVSGASSVTTGALPAFRCGDMGVALGCTGFFPFFEILTGSSNVWIEGMRAARGILDITKHCTFTSTKPSDPPLGPMLGVTLGGNGTVIIGGGPMPSLTNMLIAGMFHAVFTVAGAARRVATAERYIDHLFQRGTLRMGETASADLIRRDLVRIAETATGRQQLGRIAAQPKFSIVFEAMPESQLVRPKDAPEFLALFERNAMAIPSPEDASCPHHVNADLTRGPGSSGTIHHSPERWINGSRAAEPTVFIKQGPNGFERIEVPAPRHATSDSTLLHELTHAANNMEGLGSKKNTLEGIDPAWTKRWHNTEEFSAVHAENSYRRERGLPTRPNYDAPME